jgi:hypothetical protein
MAVLGATARLEADDALDLDLRSTPLHTHIVGESQQVFEPVVVESEYVEHLAFGQANSSFENLLARLVEDVDRRRGRANRGRGHRRLLRNQQN